MKWFAAVLTALALAGIGLSVSALTGAAHDQQNTNQQLAHVRAIESRLATELAAARQQLDARSLTGNLISCTDLRGLENDLPVTVGGNDSLGGSVTAWATLGSWVPSHCYKS